MLSQKPGKKYIVLDKAATIQSLKPAYKKLYAHFILNKLDIKQIILECLEKGRTERIYPAELNDDNNKIYLHAEKTIHIRNRNIDPDKG